MLRPGRRDQTACTRGQDLIEAVCGNKEAEAAGVPGLSLSASEDRALKATLRGRNKVSIRSWRRIRILELLDRGWKLSDIAEAVGTYPREVRRVG